MVLPLDPSTEYSLVKISLNSGKTSISFSIVDLFYLLKIEFYTTLSIEFGLSVFNTLKKNDLSFGFFPCFISGHD